MNNEKLQQKLEEISLKTNYLDQILALKMLNKEYKKSQFYKQTRIPLNRLYHDFLIGRFTSLQNVIAFFQEAINHLDFKKLDDIINNFSASFADENAQIFDSLKLFKTIGEEVFNKDKKTN